MITSSIGGLEHRQANISPPDCQRRVSLPKLPNVSCGWLGLAQFLLFPAPSQFFEKFADFVLNLTRLRNNDGSAVVEILDGPAAPRVHPVLRLNGAEDNAN